MTAGRVICRAICRGSARCLEAGSPREWPCPATGCLTRRRWGPSLRITDGNFRLLNRLLTQIARVLAINNLRQVTPAVVEVARESLVIGTA